MKKHLIAPALILAALMCSSTAFSQPSTSGIEAPPVENWDSSNTQDEQADNNEYESPGHLPHFLELGYEEIPWRSWGDEKSDVFKNLLAPDYKARTGKEAPEDAWFEFALINLTGGEFNDVITRSGLPGDCVHDGCKSTIHKLGKDGKWTVVASFYASAVVYRNTKQGEAVEVVGVGDEIAPSILMNWDGKAFIQR